jgi:hypothetical protein
MFVTPEMRKEGQLPSFTSVGCYTLLYVKKGVCLCGKCASQEKDEDLQVDTFDEGDPIPCEECGEDIESSYGPIE